MRRIVTFLSLLSMAFVACNSASDRNKLIIGKWHAVRLENPQMDSFFRNSQYYIDTIGNSKNDSVNMHLYGVTNMDSVRRMLQVQYDSAKNLQDAAVQNTTFTFRKDSVVILYFNGSVDSSKWYFDAKGSLVLDKLNDYGPGDKINMEIVTLQDSVLKLRFVENNATSTVTFHPEGK